MGHSSLRLRWKLVNNCGSLWHRNHQSHKSGCVNSILCLLGKYLAVKEAQRGLAPRHQELQLKILFEELVMDFFLL